MGNAPSGVSRNLNTNVDSAVIFASEYDRLRKPPARPRTTQVDRILSEVEEAYARLSMLEYVCEIVLANQLAEAGQESSDAEKARLIESMSNRYDSSSGDFDAAVNLRGVTERSVEMMEGFIEKVARREAAVRKEKADQQV